MKFRSPLAFVQPAHSKGHRVSVSVVIGWSLYRGPIAHSPRAKGPRAEAFFSPLNNKQSNLT
jgi:hypothetical protein